MKKGVFIVSCALGLIVGLMLGAFAAEVVKNPGHPISELGAPNGCGVGSFLKFTGTEWECGAGGSGVWTSSGINPKLIYLSATVASNVGIGTTAPNSLLSVGGPGESSYAIYATGKSYGVRADGTYRGVYGKYSGANNYGILGKSTAGVYGIGSPYAGEFDGKVQINGILNVDYIDLDVWSGGVPCNTVGRLYYNGIKNTLVVCTSDGWRTLELRPIIGGFE